MTTWAEHTKTYHREEDARLISAEETSSKQSPYYDPRRMEKALASERVKVPAGLSREQRMQFILALASSKK
jgi:hypothetical protein